MTLQLEKDEACEFWNPYILFSCLHDSLDHILKALVSADRNSVSQHGEYRHTCWNPTLCHTGKITFIDLDHFNSINDTHGHLTGSKLLAEIGTAIKEKCRLIDLRVSLRRR